MLSYFFTPKKGEEPVVHNDLVVENEKLKTDIQVLLAEKAKLQKDLEHLKRESSVYRDLMFTKVCLCNSNN